MNEEFEGKLIDGDASVNVNHNINKSEVDVNFSKRDIAQIYVTQVKADLKAKLKKAQAGFSDLKDERTKVLNELDLLINSIVTKKFSDKINKVNDVYKSLRSDIKKLVKEATKGVDSSLSELFDDIEDIDSRIKTTIVTPTINFRWDSLKVPNEDGTGSKEVLTVILNIDGHEETKQIDAPENVETMKALVKSLDSQIEALNKEISQLRSDLNDTADLRETAEAAIAAAQLKESKVGKGMLANLQSLISNDGMLNLTDNSTQDTE